jgi:hypothetical protein
VLSKTLTVDHVYKLSKELEDVLLPKKPINYMPDNSDEEKEGKEEKE